MKALVLIVLAACSHTPAPQPARQPTVVDAGESCFDACVHKRTAAGEATQMAEDECMQDCNPGE